MIDYFTVLVFIARAQLFISRILSFLRILRPMNPKISERKYYAKKIGKIKKRYGKAKSQAVDLYDEISSGNISKLNVIARKYAFRADLAWGRNIRQRDKSAWFYVLAAEIYELAESYESAGGNFHFASHEFRELGRYERAGQYYHKAALCFKKAYSTLNKENDRKGCIELAIRACKRGIGVYHQIEEHEEADKLSLLLNELQESKDKLKQLEV